MIHHIATDCTMSAKHRLKAPFINRSGLAALTCAAAFGLAGCSAINPGFNASAANPVNWITPYKVDVVQGNFVSKEQVEALKVGMSRAQVKEVLGTPLVTSLFHADRWDYVFTLKRQGIESQAFKFAVFFKGDQLERFEGDTMPSDAEFIASLTNSRKIGKVPVLQATEEQLKAAEKNSVSARISPTPATAPGVMPATDAPLTAYPPLESVRP